MQSNRSRKAVVILVLAVLASLPGCSANGPTEASARQKIKKELDNWVAGTECKATTMDWRLSRAKPPVSYKIRTVVPTEKKLPVELIARHPEAAGSDYGPAFRVVADVDFISAADTPLTKVLEYNLTWVGVVGDWSIQVQE